MLALAGLDTLFVHCPADYMWRLSFEVAPITAVPLGGCFSSFRIPMLLLWQESNGREFAVQNKTT